MKPDWNSNVQPIRVVKEAAKDEWLCDCHHTPRIQPAYRLNCPVCFARRPGS